MSDLLTSSRGRKLLFGSLYLSEGAPIGFLWWALPTKLREAGVAVEEITALTSLLVVPWIFKFVWAPLVDTVRSRGWTLRSWIVSAQLVMGATLIPLLFVNLHTSFRFVYPLLILHGFAAATQDVSVDALSIATVPHTERGSINGWMQTGMLIGRSTLGGGALLLSRTISDSAVIVLLILVVWSSTVLVAFATKNTPVDAASGGGRVRTFLSTLRTAATKRSTWFGLLFAAIGGAGFEAAGAVAGPFLIDRGFSSETVGFFFQLPVVIAMIGGALLGGYIADRIGKRLSVGIFLTSLAAVVWGLAATDAYLDGSASWITIALLTVLYLCIGLFTASSYALFMDLTDPRLGATQFSAFTGATNGCESWATYGVGRLIGSSGYPFAFFAMAAASLVALPLLWFMPSNKEEASGRSAVQ